MSYRDDHDAALARIAVLENELAVARDEAVTAAALLARSERERAQLSAELERERVRHPAKVADRDRPMVPVDADRVVAGRRSPPVNPNLGVAIAALLLLGLLVGVMRSLG